MEAPRPLHKKKDYTGATIGSWTVVGYGSSRTTLKGFKYHLWLCRCACGREQEVHVSAILYGHTKQCRSCLVASRKGKNNPFWKGHGKIPGSVLHNIRTNCARKSRHLPIDITCEYLDALWDKQDGKCIYTGRVLDLKAGASVDRIDSAFGYIEGNVQWVHIDANRAKWEMSHKEFLNMCKEIHEFAIVNNSTGKVVR